MSEIILYFLFLKITANDRGYGHERFAGVFAVAQRQSECGRKSRQFHVSQPVNIGILTAWLFIVDSVDDCLIEYSF
jgi:hypothetical protein